MGKSLLGSKTIWLNVGLGVLGVLATNIPGLSFLNSPEVIALIGGALNILNRFLTKEPITSVVPK